MSDGTPNDWIRCPYCASEDAYLQDWRPDDETTLECPDCEEWQDAAWWQGLPKFECWWGEK